MPAPYFSKGWPSYSVGEVTYEFAHLDECYMQASDSLGAERSIAVTYSDHVFTRDPMPSEDEISAFPGSLRNPFGVLCPTRYRMSVTLPAIVAGIPGQRIWNLAKDDRYAHVPILGEDGVEQLYSVVFSLDPVKRHIPYDFRLHIRTAYPCDRKVPDTFGNVRFSHLLMLRENGLHPQRNYAKGRKVPTI